MTVWVQEGAFYHRTAKNLVGEALKAFDSNQMILSMFMDLRKAFDTVSHDLVIDKLEYLGLRGIELEWFRSYMSRHRQYVDLNGKKI